VKLIVLKNNVPLNEVSVDTADLDEMYEIYVGRSEDCHVQIDDPLISRHHFVLKNENSNWYCEKLSQLGVITVNGSLISRNAIASGDEVKFGPYAVLVSDINPGPSKINSAPKNNHDSGMINSSDSQKMHISKMDSNTQAEIYSNEAEDNIAEELSAEIGESVEDLESLNSLMPESDSSLTAEYQDNSEVTNPESSEFEEGLAESSDFGDILGDKNESEDTNQDYEIATVDDANESTRFYKAFVNYQLVLFGEHAPYDRFQIDQDEVFIGRDQDKCQIVLNDPEVSSVHAVIRKKMTEIFIEDLNSSNGTILNGERINKALITTGDEFIIGSTTFTLEVKSDLLDAEKDRLMPVESGQVIETEHVEEEEVANDGTEINFEGEAVPEKSLVKRFQKDPSFRKKVIYIVAGVGLAFVLLIDSEEPPKPVAPKSAKEEIKRPNTNKTVKKELSKDLENRRNIAYELGVSFFEQNKYSEALREFQVVADIDSGYKKIQS
jgi:pSer/pThr/pTyr-binding forkhead associated (FHA) protein